VWHWGGKGREDETLGERREQADNTMEIEAEEIQLGYYQS
jgi:hypothetical protein